MEVDGWWCAMVGSSLWWWPVDGGWWLVVYKTGVPFVSKPCRRFDLSSCTRGATFRKLLSLLSSIGVDRLASYMQDKLSSKAY
jgi:hypothetical protein